MGIVDLNEMALKQSILQINSRKHNSHIFFSTSTLDKGKKSHKHKIEWVFKIFIIHEYSYRILSSHIKVIITFIWKILKCILLNKLLNKKHQINKLLNKNLNHHGINFAQLISRVTQLSIISNLTINIIIIKHSCLAE